VLESSFEWWVRRRYPCGAHESYGQHGENISDSVKRSHGQG
jgi:hypothetical protein